ncbi:hypothetical protein TELCIR_19916 [Teladorsagia circumcincta]|uniref:SCP domain-containing protein n=1 Tax=Teladorsagia circumcincta TaxID=45464 RepID=A0A2G9TKW6_TELCI|nr:hypothetical protein TELCIR_19916 [Teladorsagia circumcincta]
MFRQCWQHEPLQLAKESVKISDEMIDDNSVDRPKSHNMRAVYGWTDEIRRLGTRDDINEIFHGIGHATQVFWDTTFSLGCGVIKCDDGRTSVVCHYYPA